MMNNVRVTPIKVVRRKGDDCIIDEADDDYDDYDLRGKTRRGYETIASSSCGSPRRCLQLNTKSGEGSSETLSEEDGSSRRGKRREHPEDDPARTSNSNRIFIKEKKKKKKKKKNNNNNNNNENDNENNNNNMIITRKLKTMFSNAWEDALRPLP